MRFFHTPGWWQETSWRSRMLLPLSYLYYAAVKRRAAKIVPYKAPVTVICVGNVTVGGTGKTPLSMALAALLQQKGVRVCFLSRGYGGTLTGPVKVDAAVHTASEVGDEPLLLAKVATCWVSHDRVAGVKAAVADGAELVIMDDGFQNPALVKDIALLVIDGARGIGNGAMLPAGPLREPFDAALKRADAVVIMGEDCTDCASLVDSPLFRARLVPQGRKALRGKRSIAFAGIGHPARFFTTLEEAGAVLVQRHAFPDHYPYSANDIAMLQSEAAREQAVLITTEKDTVRLPVAVRNTVETLQVRVEWQNEEQLKMWLYEKIALPR